MNIMNIVDIIEKKKKSIELTGREIKFVIDGIMDGSIKDYQISSLLMAICLRGMNSREIYDLTMAMRDSGDVLDLSKIGCRVVDKHSTGGVGDKTTLIIGPIMASLGVPIAKMSGRGLGITGGTIDKLDSIPGFSSDISDDDFIKQVHKVGMVDAAQTKNLAPADKYLYALRDVTGTVDSIGLIASSIMSKKLASGADSIVLDVKCGSGAFMKDRENAALLASTMIDIAKRAGKMCSAIITDMNQPLGYTVGNLLEVQEAGEFLYGIRREERLLKLIISLCTEMYILSDKYKELYDKYINEFEKKSDAFSDSSDKAYIGFLNKKIESMIMDSLDSGKAFDKFKEFINAQGGSTEKNEEIIKSNQAYDYMKYYDGYSMAYVLNLESNHNMSHLGDGDMCIKRIDAEKIGKISLLLGAGRITKEDEIDLRAGIKFDKLVGHRVKDGDQIAILYSKDKSKLEEAIKLMDESVEYGFCEAFQASYNDIILEILK